MTQAPAQFLMFYNDMSYVKRHRQIANYSWLRRESKYCYNLSNKREGGLGYEF